MVFGTSSDFNQFLNANEFFKYTAPKILQIKPELTEEKSQESSKRKISDYLVAFSTQSQSFCVGCVDMVNSTKMSAIIPARKLSVYYDVFLNSMSMIIGRFGGKVIKNVGDCLLYYFPDVDKDKGFTNCLDSGLAMIQAQSIICQQLKTRGLPCLSYRVSADFGNVIVMNTSDSTSIDMIGPPVNMCTKINHCAKSNEFVVGGDFYEIAKRNERYSFKAVTGCNVGFKLSYPVYKVSA
jgi:class 3 adenylate cyclase